MARNVIVVPDLTGTGQELTDTTIVIFTIIPMFSIIKQEDFLGMKNPIDLSVGVPEELTAQHIKTAGVKAIKQDKTVYTPANGLPELRASIAKRLQDNSPAPMTDDNVTIVPGLTTGQLLVYLSILDPGDEVIVLDPYYPPYVHLAPLIGAQVMLVNTLPSFQPDIPAIKASITNKTKAIVINSPNNPTGAVYNQRVLEQIAKLAGEHDLFVVSDEIYEHFVYVGQTTSIRSFYPNTITMNGFSKEYAMTGWRLGYIAGPVDVIESINELLQYVVFSSSSIAQHAALAALQHRPDLVLKYKKKRDFLVTALRKLGYVINGAQGAYYLFVQAPNGLTDIEFSGLASEHNLIIVPGRAFSSRHGYVRLSYGAPMSQLEKAVEVFADITKLHQ